MTLSQLFVLFFKIYKSKKQKKNITYFTAFFPGNSGYEWRVNQWAKLLRKRDYKVEIQHAFSSQDYYEVKPKNFSLFLLKALHKRFWQVVKSRKYEIVIVRREVLLYNDYGNLFLDRLLLKIHPNAILDFDDDIAVAKREPRELKGMFSYLLRENGTKFTDSLKLYNYFITGSSYLKNYTLNINKQLNENQILILPTCVDYDKYQTKEYNLFKKTITIGWVGGNHNLFLLDTVIPGLNKITQKQSIELLVIAGRDYKNNKALFPIINEHWSLETEIESIKKIDIGIMPLKTTLRDKGKCSFKLIQYMGLGIVSLATNVGMNKEVISTNNKEGFLVDNNWEETLSEVIANKEEWPVIGANARKKILNNYIFTANIDKLTNFLENLS